MVKAELANLVENYLIGLSTQGKIQGQITDDQLKKIFKENKDLIAENQVATSEVT